MDKADTNEVLCVIFSAFPRQTEVTEDQLNVWHMLLKDWPKEIIKEATVRVLRTSKFPPVPAHILEAATAILAEHAELPTAEQAWEMVSRLSFYDAAPLATLPRCVADAVRALGTLRDILTSDNIEVVRAQYYKAYNNIRERILLAAQSGLLTAIDNAVARLDGGNHGQKVLEHSER